MTFAEYQKAVTRTWIDKPEKPLTDKEHMFTWAVLGMAGEAAEIVAAIDGYEERETIIKEIGDFFFYFANCCTLMDINIDSVTTDIENIKGSSFSKVALTKKLLKRCCHLCEFVKKGVFHRHGVHVENLKTQLVLVFLTLAEIVLLHEFTFSFICETNIEKLKVRFPDGWDMERAKPENKIG